MADAARRAPAAERNKEPILGTLRGVLPESGLVVEIASGTGQHVVHFAAALPKLTWQPSDPDPESRRSIEAWIAETELQNVLPPLALNVHDHPWPLAKADAVVSEPDVTC
jgi:tRNA G46 methylase TrmB